MSGAEYSTQKSGTSSSLLGVPRAFAPQGFRAAVAGDELAQAILVVSGTASEPPDNAQCAQEHLERIGSHVISVARVQVAMIGVKTNSAFYPLEKAVDGAFRVLVTFSLSRHAFKTVNFRSLAAELTERFAFSARSAGGELQQRTVRTPSGREAVYLQVCTCARHHRGVSTPEHGPELAYRGEAAHHVAAVPLVFRSRSSSTFPLAILSLSAAERVEFAPADPAWRGLLVHQLAWDRAVLEYFVLAGREMEMQCDLTGELGKRMKFQQHGLAEAVLLAASRKTLALNDVTRLLEQTEFTSLNSAVPNLLLGHLVSSAQPALRQPILPPHGLTNEQMSPYITRVISHPQKLSIHTLLCARLESDHMRTIERSGIQLRALVEQMCAANATLSRMDFSRLTSLAINAVIKSSPQIFECLEMWGRRLSRIGRRWDATRQGRKVEVGDIVLPVPMYDARATM
ncbi:hypothetical protein FA95DRAFT_1672071 [Auriscalpium vulgare]|uniref:Uncharacterized protein n=1 Tax=Auriscalpium vulgare TaxID=40419 RepID=A0ACB8R1E9_9AGAM|nr:hypothetical protein FA95DRAFT_1672071 [Auriscalpium vulgare]